MIVDNLKRAWISQETEDQLNTPAENGCQHPRSDLRLAWKGSNTTIFCPNCGTSFDALGWAPANITDEDKALAFWANYVKNGEEYTI